MAIPAKRVDIVSLKMVKESSRLYKPRHINRPQDAAALIRDLLSDSDREKIMAICLDSKNQPTCITTVSIGTLTSSTAHPREVFKTAITSNSAGIILAHNHPSGDLSPSRDDITTTERLKEAGDLLGIDLLDHLIIGQGDRYLSFREQGLM